jgi:hypothetical protein
MAAPAAMMKNKTLLKSGIGLAFGQKIETAEKTGIYPFPR